MLGLMQSQPLLISTLVEFAERHHGDAQIVSRRVEGDIHRYTYRDMAARARQLANTLDGEGLSPSARVASLAWNGYRHLEMYYGVSGSGRVLHTINPRLHPDQVAWIVNHAEDEVLCFDLTFLPIVQAVHAKCPTVRRWVALCDADRLPQDTGIPQLTSYESWIGAASSEYAWPVFDENSASSLCYTSGTTGHPKGVLYSHRSSVLHAYAAALPDVMGLSASDSVLPVVPMFHVNAWGIPYSAPLTGCKLVFPGPALDGKSVYDLMDAEGVTFAAGVPTVWQMLLQHVKSIGGRFGKLRRTVIGGSACPPAMIEAFQNDYGVRVLHAWGMTEMSPLGTLCSLKNKHMDLPEPERMKILLKQGRAIYGVDMKIVDGDGRELPWDGRTYGDLLVKGPWIVDRYYRSDESPLVPDAQGRGWFPTGDVATIDPDGYMQITDRSKDVIKSGGEWISSIDIENIAMAHPAVAMAACVGMPHPKWDERPIVAVVRRQGAELTREELLAFYEGKTAKWQIPDDVVFLDAIPIGATGKMLKARLRDQLQGYRLPGL
ncbi:long-chain fatty acid--CoA ligase [Paracidovorax avenae]|uniref:O-succinylbenzoate--CoA ligase n=1 Tax=Paracidovorax avenae (strain ATCC 19860 / DSM 7227 / CCUG 15838 / JCM 20985 / LMG 2117 / NCPPB 1011) TaxID=643561 RepID=F0QD18_PARA1|nr:3-(methylthio)propionyl-CoA ligase [Paracidovorax avenae]ADX46262.1 o-succinylbenzoate--CoA ligase [Paracidovorax avenae ATCC 19860]AVS62171.1 long-chain fatty acid--CoA ligase [Paracidovorax avenae]AVS67524.1 long-chain fatty acid--CoA ligase [Paracidovorax avenae]AVS70705.1 long-chain fatty acid--CoA ligase [Paracidovorax avenae]